MAITAKFQADFASFYDAVDQADAKLKDFQSGAAYVEGALNRMADALSGRKMIQEATLMAKAVSDLGGVSTLTTSQLQKFGTLAADAIERMQKSGIKEIPGDLQAIADAAGRNTKAFAGVDESAGSLVGNIVTGIPLVNTFVAAFSVERMFAFAVAATEAASQIENLSRATGVSTDGLQRLQYVGQEAGVDLDQLSRGVEQFSAKLATGDTSATKAVESLGLSVKDLIALGPEQAFVAFTAAATNVQDPMDKAGLYTEAFGARLGKLLLSLGDVTDAMNHVPRGAIISPENITRAHEMDVKWQHLKDTIENVAVDLAVRTGEAFGIVASKAEAATAAAQGADVELVSSAQLWEHGLDSLRSKQEALIGINAEQVTSEAALGVSVKDLAAHYGVSEVALASLIEAQKKFDESVKEVATTGEGWRGTLETINGDVEQGIRFYLEAGVAQDKLATFYGVSATQVKAVATALKEEAAAQKKSGDAAIDAANLWQQYDDIVSEGGTTYEKQGAAIDKWYNALVAAHQKAGTDTAEFYAAASALDDKYWAQLEANTLKSDPYTREHFQSLADAAEKAYNFALDHSTSYTNREIQNFHDAYVSAEQDASHWSVTANEALDKVEAHTHQVTSATRELAAAVVTLAGEYISAAEAQKRLDQGNSITYDLSNDEGLAHYRKLNPAASIAWSDSEIENFIKKGGTLQQLIQEGIINPYSGFSGVSKFATGVTDFSGGMAIVGEEGPELVSLPAGSSVTPAGQWGGGVSANITINGVIDAAGRQALAKLISTELMALSGRKR